MKLFASLLAAVVAGCLIRGIPGVLEKFKRPNPDFASQALRKAVKRLLARNYPPASRYIQHITPMLNEVPLPTGIDVEIFLALHGVTGVILWILAGYAMPGAALWLFPICLAAGTVIPYAWLRHAHGKFQTALLHSMPECLDLQALVMEAGLDLSAGLQHYLDKGSPSPLKHLLRGVQKDIQLGRSRSDAFSILAQKTSYYPLREVCRGIVQALSLGTSLSPLLKEQAAALRIKRMQVAEKRAAEAPLKVLFPLFLFIFPTILIVLIGPMAIMFLRGGF